MKLDFNCEAFGFENAVTGVSVNLNKGYYYI